MERTEIQRLRDLPIEGVAERLGLRVVHHKALCPFHDDHHASLSFHPAKNSYRCFVCDAHGDTISLVQGMLRMDFPEACRWLGDNDCQPLRMAPPPRPQPKCFDASRYERFFLHPRLSEEARRFLYDERRLDPRVVRWCRLSSWRDAKGTQWLQIPYYDAQGQLIGLQNRRLSPSAVSSEPRFRFPQGSRCGIYNLPVLGRLSEGDELWITEGCSDCWAMLSSGRKAVAIPSATLLSHTDRELLRGIRQGISFHMYPDQDLPGERLFLALQQILPHLQHHQLPPGCKDYGDYFRNQGMTR